MKLNVDDLVEQGLVKKKTYTEGKYKGLSVLKYHRKVFYKNLWHLDERLLECRGTVVDEDDNVIVLPFRKVFNIGENFTQVPDDVWVMCPQKVNGFMGAVTYNEKYGFIYSTTGSLDSDFSAMVEKWFNTLNKDAATMTGITFLFEICDQSDPHIVEENEGIYLIGARKHSDFHFLLGEDQLDTLADSIGCLRPTVETCQYKDLKKQIKEVTHEGFMIRHQNNFVPVIAKMKSPHYLTKKALMRLGEKNIDVLFTNKGLFKRRIDEEYYDLVDYIVEKFDKETWMNYSEQERRVFIEEYFYGQ